jgi:hypothetical protein
MKLVRELSDADSSATCSRAGAGAGAGAVGGRTEEVIRRDERLGVVRALPEQEADALVPEHFGQIDRACDTAIAKRVNK